MKYAPMIRVSFSSVMTSHLTTFVPWKRVASTLQTWGWSRMTIHTLPYAPSTTVVLIGNHTMLYLRFMRQYAWSVILVSASIIRSKPPICTAQMACTSPDQRPLQMLRFPRDSPRGRCALQRDDGGAVWRQSLIWLIGQVIQMGILVGSIKTMSYIDLCSFCGRSGLVPYPS